MKEREGKKGQVVRVQKSNGCIRVKEERKRGKNHFVFGTDKSCACRREMVVVVGSRRKESAAKTILFLEPFDIKNDF